MYRILQDNMLVCGDSLTLKIWICHSRKQKRCGSDCFLDSIDKSTQVIGLFKVPRFCWIDVAKLRSGRRRSPYKIIFSDELHFHLSEYQWYSAGRCNLSLCAATSDWLGENISSLSHLTHPRLLIWHRETFLFERPWDR